MVARNKFTPSLIRSLNEKRLQHNAATSFRINKLQHSHDMLHIPMSHNDDEYCLFVNQKGRLMIFGKVFADARHGHFGPLKTNGI